MAPLRCLHTFLLVALCLLAAVGVQAESLRLPLTVDMELLRTLIVQQAYTIPGEKANILNMGQGCNQITLFSPRVSVDQGYLRFQTGVTIKWGTPVLGSCLTPLVWEGSVVLWQRPRINGQWQLSFETVNSLVLDKGGRQINAIDLLWNLIKDHVHSYLDKITINLAPPVTDMKASLLPMFGPDQQAMAQRFLASMRPEQPIVQSEGVQLHILAEIDLPPRTDAPPVPASQQDYARVIELWHSWDAFLVFQLKQFTEYPLTEEDRQILLDAMLTARYEFSEAIAEQKVTTEFIRGQFLRGWSQLAPVFRNHLPKRRKNNLLGYLAFFTASDALRVLDQLGPAVGLEISAGGFRRLAALISPTPYEDPGQDSEEVDPELRKVLGLEPLPEEELPSDQPIPVTAPTDGEPTSCAPPSGWRHLVGLFAPTQAWAAAAGQPTSQKDIRRWTAGITPASDLLPRVQEVLLEASAGQHKRLSQGAGRTAWFDTMVLASAWQESCFRQFHIDKNAITFLLSYNNTSVGIMQVHEKVWRGVYNTRQLRWNIAYNSRAGSEILSLYLRDYLLKSKAPLDLTTVKGQRFLAGWLYALYNGGPGQRKPFVTRYNDGKLYRSEQLFLAKYDTVSKGDWMGRVRCLP